MEKEDECKERSVRAMLMPHEYAALKAEADKERRSPPKQLRYILEKRYKNIVKCDI